MSAVIGTTPEPVISTSEGMTFSGVVSSAWEGTKHFVSVLINDYLCPALNFLRDKLILLIKSSPSWMRNGYAVCVCLTITSATLAVAAINSDRFGKVTRFVLMMMAMMSAAGAGFAYAHGPATMIFPS